jgi:hypothetical protein
MLLIILMGAAVLVAIYVLLALDLRQRAIQERRRPRRGIGPEGWRPLQEIRSETAADDVADENPFTRIGHSRSRRGR